MRLQLTRNDSAANPSVPPKKPTQCPVCMCVSVAAMQGSCLGKVASRVQNLSPSLFVRSEEFQGLLGLQGVILCLRATFVASCCSAQVGLPRHGNQRS